MSGAGGAGVSSESDEEYQADSEEEVLSDEGEGMWRCYTHMTGKSYKLLRSVGREGGT